MKEYRFKINDKEYNVTVEGIKDGKASVCVNGTPYTVDCPTLPAPAPAAPQRPAATPQATPQATAASAPAPKATAPASSGKVVEAPLPGVLTGLLINQGQAVKRGQKIAVLEAMKMENDILSPADGTVLELFVQRGDSVLEGAKIAVIG